MDSRSSVGVKALFVLFLQAKPVKKGCTINRHPTVLSFHIAKTSHQNILMFNAPHHRQKTGDMRCQQITRGDWLLANVFRPAETGWLLLSHSGCQKGKNVLLKELAQCSQMLVIRALCPFMANMILQLCGVVRRSDQVVDVGANDGLVRN